MGIRTIALNGGKGEAFIHRLVFPVGGRYPHGVKSTLTCTLVGTQQVPTGHHLQWCRRSPRTRNERYTRPE